jgi:hypothetical protein
MLEVELLRRIQILSGLITHPFVRAVLQAQSRKHNERSFSKHSVLKHAAQSLRLRLAKPLFQ